MSIQYQWVDKKEKFEVFLKEVAKEKVLALDTEFLRESTFFPRLCLIQVGTKTQNYLIDPLSLTKEDLSAFSDILVNPKILKLFHASRGDQESFYYYFGVVATPVFDTSTAAAVIGMQENIGLSRLLKELLKVDLPKGHARVFWDRRPLSRELLEYAARDVQYLPAAYQKLKKKLVEKKRLEWVLEASQLTKKDIEEDPIDLAKRLIQGNYLDVKKHVVLCKLVHWREKKIREKNIPRNWFMSNDLLLTLVKANPKEEKDLIHFRGVGKTWIQKYGSEFFSVVRSKEDILGSTLLTVENTTRGNSPPNAAGAEILFRAFLEVLGVKKEIHPNFLVPPKKISMLLRHSKLPLKELVAKNILTQNAATLAGRIIKNFLDGKQGLYLKGSNITLKK